MRLFAWAVLGCCFAGCAQQNGPVTTVPIGNEPPTSASEASATPTPSACAPDDPTECAPCETGEAASCYKLASRYHQGEGVTKNPATAVSLYGRACALGHSGGCLFQASMYSSGEGVEQDVAKARQLYQAACEGGDEGACISVRNIDYDSSLKVRVDGLYRGEVFGTPTFYRFYEDGVVISASTSAPPDKLCIWFTRDKPDVSRGSYKFDSESERITIEVNTPIPPHIAAALGGADKFDQRRTMTGAVRPDAMFLRDDGSRDPGVEFNFIAIEPSWDCKPQSCSVAPTWNCIK